MEPAKFRRALEYLKQAGVFAAVSGVLVGKPMDGVWQAEYEALLPQVIADPELPVVCGVPVGHALPRCIVPFGVTALGCVSAKVKSDFSNAGINQTIHTLTIRMTADFSIRTLGRAQTVTVSAEYPLEETIVVGDVPLIAANS